MLKIYSIDEITGYGGQNVLSPDGDIKRMFFNTKHNNDPLSDYHKVTFTDNELIQKDRCGIMAWIARNIAYDVYCIKCEVVDKKSYDNELEKLSKKGIFGRKDPSSFDVRYEAERLAIKNGIWHFCFCDPADAVQFKLVWG